MKLILFLEIAYICTLSFKLKASSPSLGRKWPSWVNIEYTGIDIYVYMQYKPLDIWYSKLINIKQCLDYFLWGIQKRKCNPGDQKKVFFHDVLSPGKILDKIAFSYTAINITVTYKAGLSLNILKKTGRYSCIIALCKLDWEFHAM